MKNLEQEMNRLENALQHGEVVLGMTGLAKLMLASRMRKLQTVLLLSEMTGVLDEDKELKEKAENILKKFEEELKTLEDIESMTNSRMEDIKSRKMFLNMAMGVSAN